MNDTEIKMKTVRVPVGELEVVEISNLTIEQLEQVIFLYESALSMGVIPVEHKPIFEKKLLEVHEEVGSERGRP